MKHSRHPYCWRVFTVRALALSTLVALSATSASAAKSKPAPAAETPSPASATPSPTVDFSAPDMPMIALPSLSPTMPSVGTTAPTAAAPAHEAPRINATRRANELKVADYQRNRTTRTSHNDRIDYADALIHIERYDDAIAELQDIEERFPEAYINAHLLGVAYERSGNLKAARQWFETAVSRDPDAQEGTGWLRVAMIEAHLALQENPAWLSKHSIFDGAAGRSEADLIRAVDVQVHQRRDYFAANDPVIADLYFQLGVRMNDSEARNKYFALSMETHPLRQQDIEGQLVIRAQGPAAKH